MKILLIEDDEAIVETIRTCLTLNIPDYELDATDNGSEALFKLARDHYEIALVDLGLPDIDGIEVIKMLRAFSDVPVLVISARNDKDDITQAIACGANDYMIKPFDPHDLSSRLQKMLDLKAE
jgi:DNA-binding response OmpR family regulator